MTYMASTCTCRQFRWVTFYNHKVLKKLQRLYLNDQNNSLKSRVGHNRCAFLIITHTHFPTAIDATLFSWTLQADDKLTLVNNLHAVIHISWDGSPHLRIPVRSHRSGTPDKREFESYTRLNYTDFGNISINTTTAPMSGVAIAADQVLRSTNRNGSSGFLWTSGC